MSLQSILSRNDVWLFVTLVSLTACTLIPLRIRNEAVRARIYRWILVPISLILILYAYPKGIEIFSDLASGMK